VTVRCARGTRRSLRTILKSSFFLLSKTQDFWKRISLNRESSYSWEVLIGKIAENVTGRHLQKEIAAEIFGDGGRIMPADTVCNVVREIARNELRGPHGSSVYVADVNRFRLFQIAQMRNGVANSLPPA